MNAQINCVETSHFELWEKINQIDLGPIRFKIVNCSENNQLWSIEKVQRVEKEYRRFLFLLIVEGDNKSIVPTTDIDYFWHTHILDTAKYADDCQETFGKFVHHFPYLGMRSDKDRDNLISSFGVTVSLFKKYFNEVPKIDSGMSACDAESCGGCDHRGITNENGLLSERPTFSY